MSDRLQELEARLEESERLRNEVAEALMREATAWAKDGYYGSMFRDLAARLRGEGSAVRNLRAVGE